MKKVERQFFHLVLLALVPIDVSNSRDPRNSDHKSTSFLLEQDSRLMLMTAKQNLIEHDIKEEAFHSSEKRSVWEMSIVISS